MKEIKIKLERLSEWELLQKLLPYKGGVIKIESFGKCFEPIITELGEVQVVEIDKDTIKTTLGETEIEHSWDTIPPCLRERVSFMVNYFGNEERLRQENIKLKKDLEKLKKDYDRVYNDLIYYKEIVLNYN